MLRDIPLEEIKETMENPDKVEVFLNTDSGTYRMYLKNFDYYNVFCLGTDFNSEPRIHIKLPTRFVERYGSDLNQLLEEFLKITGITGIIDGDSSVLIKEFSHEEKILALNPQTLNGAVFFGCSDGDKTRNFFGVQKIKHNKMLEDYEVKK